MRIGQDKEEFTLPFTFYGITEKVINLSLRAYEPITVKPVLRGPHIKRTPARVPRVPAQYRFDSLILKYVTPFKIFLLFPRSVGVFFFMKCKIQFVYFDTMRCCIT